MKSNRFNFRKKDLDALPLPDRGKRLYFHDSKTRGLILAVTSNGTKTFMLYRKIQNKPERIVIGRYPDMSIAQARGRADGLNAAIAKGENPAAEVRSVRTSGTFGELFTEYIERHAKKYKRSWREDEGQYDRHLKTWARRKLGSITQRDVERLHTAVRDRVKADDAKQRKSHGGEYAANRVLALLRAVFTKGVEWGAMKFNPAAGIRMFEEQKRDRFLERDEAKAFFDALKGRSPLMRDFVLMALFTGGRRRNVQAMQWEQVHLERGIWTVPAERTKTRKKYEIPLVPEAAAILESRRKANETNSEWVFASDTKSGHLEEPKMAWAKILKTAKMRDFRVHDLRRSLASWMAMTGASELVIARALGHSVASVTAGYGRSDLEAIRAAMSKAVQAMLEAGRPKDEEEATAEAEKGADGKVVDLAEHRKSG